MDRDEDDVYEAAAKIKREGGRPGWLELGLLKARFPHLSDEELTRILYAAPH